jgi:hypothetical protein
MSSIQLPGGSKIEIPGGKPVSFPLVAGNVPHCAPTRAAFIVQGRAHSDTAPGHFRVIQGAERVKIYHNNRKTAMAVEIIGAGPVIFEARAYSRNAQFRRFKWEAGEFTII